MHHPRGIRFSWMDSCSQYDGFPYSDFFRLTRKISDDQHIYIIPSKTFAEHRFPDFIFVFKSACLTLKFEEVGVRIWVAMRKINCIHIMLRCILKGQAIVIGTISIIRRLLRRQVCVHDLMRGKVLITTELICVLIFECFFQASCIIVPNILAFSLPSNLVNISFF
jgi:hypothetical protein